MKTTLNINDTIWIEINDFWWKVVEQHYRDFFNNDKDVSDYIKWLKHRTKEYDIDGEKRNLTELQIHEFMNLFGENAYCGGDQFIVNNKIYLSVN